MFNNVRKSRVSLNIKLRMHFYSWIRLHHEGATYAVVYCTSVSTLVPPRGRVAALPRHSRNSNIDRESAPIDRDLSVFRLFRRVSIVSLSRWRSDVICAARYIRYRLWDFEMERYDDRKHFRRSLSPCRVEPLSRESPAARGEGAFLAETQYRPVGFDDLCYQFADIGCYEFSNTRRHGDTDCSI